MLVAIDPGTKALGWARFTPEGRLVSCGVSRTIERTSDGQIDAHARALGIGADRAVVEEMEIRPGRVESQPADLLRVQAVGCAVAGLVALRVSLLPPSRWKGSIPKRVHHVRIRSALSGNEREIVDRAAAGAGAHAKEVLDAVGLGLYALRRTSRSGCERTRG